MKASFIIVASGAASVMAGPVMKRVMTTTTSIETVYTTIYLGDEPTPTSTQALPTEDTNPDVGVESFPTGGTSPDISGPEGGYDYDSIVAEPQPTTTSTPEVVVVTPTPAPEEPITTEEPVPEQTTASSAAPVETTAPSSGSLSDIAVHHHNIHRSNHSAPSMTWGEDYASYADTLAKSCIFDHNTTIGGGGYGQNIAMTASTGPLEDPGTFLARSITEMWYNGEINLFPADAYGQATPSGNFHDWGHYTQIIWEGSTVVGCAVKLCHAGENKDNGGTFTMDGYFSVCNYYPAGNMFGAFDTNVKAPGGEATVNV